MNVNSNIITAGALVQRAKQIADISNSDFLSYDELVKYLNNSFLNCQVAFVLKM